MIWAVMGNHSELMNQFREILDPPATSPLADDLETKLRMIEKFINSRYVPRATYDKKLNGYRHRELKATTEVTDLVAPKPLANTDVANPPTTSINEILEQLYHEAFYAGYRQDEITQKVVMPGATTAIRTLIASVRPAKYNNWSDVPDKAVGGLPSYTKKRAYQKAHNQALQDYDNAIKELFNE